MIDHSTGRSRGFGFVTFESEETVEKIISEGNMHDLGGKLVSFHPDYYIYELMDLVIVLLCKNSTELPPSRS